VVGTPQSDFIADKNQQLRDLLQEAPLAGCRSWPGSFHASISSRQALRGGRRDLDGRSTRAIPDSFGGIASPLARMFGRERRHSAPRAAWPGGRRRCRFSTASGSARYHPARRCAPRPGSGTKPREMHERSLDSDVLRNQRKCRAVRCGARRERAPLVRRAMHPPAARPWQPRRPRNILNRFVTGGG